MNTSEAMQQSPQKPGDDLQRLECYFDFSQGEKAYNFGLSLIRTEFEVEMSYEPQERAYRIHLRQKIATPASHCKKLLAELNQKVTQFGGRQKK
jgi:hypothetical protein